MSRLDRLVVLLETGSTPFIRSTAADQLSDLAKAHPEDIISLLGRVYPFLKADKWDTRIAAAKAFGGIVSHAPQWDPNSEEAIEMEKTLENLESTEASVKKEQDEELRKLDENMLTLVSFDLWNLFELLKSGKKLLALGGAEYVSKDHELLLKIKKHKSTIAAEASSNVKTEPVDAVKAEPVDATPLPEPAKAATSARLKAMQRRRAKVNAKVSANKTAPVDLLQSSISRKLVEGGEGSNTAADNANFELTAQQGGSKLVMETRAPELSPLLSQHAKVAGLVWQFQGVYELLVSNMFDEKWEIRHGSMLGLRELIRTHGKGAGRVMNKSREQNDANNAHTLADLAVRICTLFALDRFADYVNDTVVAPVRESGAQTLAALLLHLDVASIIKTFECLQSLVLQDQCTKLDLPRCWEAKHGGMLGVRYFVSVRTDVLLLHQQLLDSVVSMVLHCLKESEDDVQSVAALTLAPIASEFIKSGTATVKALLLVVWDCLSNFEDDLSASVGSVMDLLSKLCKHAEVIEIMQSSEELEELDKLVPKLYPFLRHSITNVRKATLNTLLEFLQIDDPSTKMWISAKILRLIFQNLLVEQNLDVLETSKTVFDSLLREIKANPKLPSVEELFRAHMDALLPLLMTPIGIARHNYQMDTSLIIKPSSSENSDVFAKNEYAPHANGGSKRGRKRPAEKSELLEELKINIDAPIYNGDVMFVGVDTFVATRSAASTAFGKLMALMSPQCASDIAAVLLNNIGKAPHSTPRLFSAIILEEFAISLNDSDRAGFKDFISALSEALLAILSAPDGIMYFRELVPTLKSVRTSCLQLFDVFLTKGNLPPSKVPQIPVIVQGEAGCGPGAFGLDSAQKIIDETYPKLLKALPTAFKLSSNASLEDAKHRITIALNEAKFAYTQRLTSILASHAAAVLCLTGVPAKLNPIIRSLMDSIKQEELSLLQERSAKAVALLIQELNNVGKKGAADKILKNLFGFICVDTSEVPEYVHNSHLEDKILSLRKEEAKSDPIDIAAHEKAVHEARIKRSGALLAMGNIIANHGSAVFERLPKLYELLFTLLALLKLETGFKTNQEGQSVIDALGVLRAILPKLPVETHKDVVAHLDELLAGLKSKLSVLRYSSAKCLATIASVVPSSTFPFFISSVLPMLNNASVFQERQGAIEAVYHVTSTMGADILPYIVFLIVPVMGRMSDANQDVRVLASTTFASIIKLVPLEAGIPDPPGMPADLLEGREREREFIQQMMDPTKIQSFELPVSIKATLRKYQQDGVNWLAFLNKYHLHGILCDDMGLGKTLQTICIVASDHHIRADKFAETKADEFRPLPTLIVCPPSLTGHWEQELNQYAPFLKVVVYAGGPSARAGILAQIALADVVVTSYDVCRNDIEKLYEQSYNYCVLDEGHIIKNSASKLTKSVKRLQAEHRLILSGTPIQNNVLELWSLFDFLMPGFLGTEKIFMEKFAKPIAASRNSKTSSKEQEAGALALESLHRQVLPFMLRRLKEDVLSDLPPKIIQDYYCELSELQRKLYADFVKKQKTVVKDELGKDDAMDTGEENQKTHIFQALQYMRKLCNHPALVVTPNHPQSKLVSEFLASKKTDLRSIEHAPKLKSLETLLLECGIGTKDSDYSSAKYKAKQKQQQEQMMTAEGVISEHRALIFCQLKDMLDIVEDELLKKHMPSVTYMRLDGRTDPRNRQAIVRKFNEDPSIDVLLLTTKVGGLGLNLTGADTVIFVEHDWNPMSDLQAMDRAHRLGQKKVVNVYRLITKGTLEEKIMGLQKFKMNIALTIVNQQNAGLSSMDTNQILDLFDADDVPAKSNGDENKGKDIQDELTGGLVPTDAVGELGQLWDEQQYEDEYNLDTFIKTLK